MGFGLKIAQKGLLLVALPSLFEVAFVLILSNLLSQAEQEAALEAHSKEVIACANNLTRATIDATTAAGAYKITGNDLFAQRSDLACEGARRHVDRLRELLKNKTERLKDLRSVERLTNQLYKVVDGFKNNANPDEVPSLATIIGRGEIFRELNRLVNQLGVVTNSLIADELRVEFESPLQRARTREHIKYVLFGGVVLNVVLAFFLALYFSRSVTRRLLIVRENTERLARRQLLVPAIGGTDEISDLDAAFHKTAKRLEELEQFKQQLIGIVSHELKTPLSSMQVNIAIMSEGVAGELPEKAKQKVRVLETNVNRLIRLINDLLDIEKMESGKFELLIKDCRLSDLLNSACEAVAPLAEEKKIRIDIPEITFTVPADHDRILQVLLNLLSNAIKYSQANSVITVKVEESSEFLELKVIDQGRGIPESHISKIFDRFQQVEKTDETVKGGTGLGLAIARAIVEEHGGAIGVESKLGQGSTFWFRLPKQKAVTALLPFAVEQEIKQNIE
ncbi:MAG: CHASE3 domain-containing protein [Candidatus Obscuribacterales bacterium]|nr:CHASE3 domain-containing protein [Candidatus Obscuribacterales bacterium]